MDFQDNDNNIQELMNIFQVESEEILERIFENLLLLESRPADKELAAVLYRDLHSIKGAIRMVGFNNIQNIIHKIEDIFDKINTDGVILDSEKILVITKSLELVSKYLHTSVENQREIIGEDFKPTLSALEYICDVELAESNFNEPIETIASLAAIAEAQIQDSESNDLQNHQEEINFTFNNCFEIIDGIVPEEESQEIVILREELAKIYEILKDSNLYEVKTALQNVLTKLDFVMNATNAFTISEILEMRNELSSAAAKFNTSCIDDVASGITFFDIAEKITMLQGSSVYAKEIKDDVLQIKASVEDSSIMEIVTMIVEILDFIIENSVQLEEQMTQTLKSGVEYCASPNESIDGDLIIQQLEIMKQLLELNFKKDTGVSEIKNLSTQSSVSNKSASSTEIKTLHVNAQKLDLLVNQLGELIITKIKTEKNLEKIDLIKNSNEKNINKKMNSDRALLSYKNDIEFASMNIRKNNTTYIGGALTIKYNNRVNIVISGINTYYKHFNANYFLHYKIIDYYKKTHKYIDLNGITGDFSSNNPYYGLNNFKIGFNSNLYEFIGEFDLILNKKTYNTLNNKGLLAKEFNHKKKKGN